MRELARAYNSDPNHPLALHLFIDVHAHSVCMNCFVFANEPESADPQSLENVAAFPRALGNHLHACAQSGPKYQSPKDPAKQGTGRQALLAALPGVHSYTLELSFFCAAQVRPYPYFQT